MNCAFIRVESSPWHRRAALGPVAEIDCNLTERLWAPDCTHANARLRGQGAELTLKRPLLFCPSAPLVHFFPSFNQSPRLRPRPPSPVFTSPHRSLLPRFPVLHLWSPASPLLVSVSFRSPCRRTVEVAPLGWRFSTALVGSVSAGGIHLLLSVYL